MGNPSATAAVYLQGTYNLGGVASSLEGLRLTLGYRYTWDAIDGFVNSYNFGAVNPGNFVCGNTGASVANSSLCLLEGHLRSSPPTWNIGLDYDLTSNILLYGRISRGYKAGGFNTYSVRPETVTFGPEEVTSYEAGFKSDFHVHEAPARLNVNLFYFDYQSIQRSADDVLGTVSGAQTLSTASAREHGIEIEGLIRPTGFLEVGGNYSHIEAEYKHFPYTVTGFFPFDDCGGTPKTANSGSIVSAAAISDAKYF